MRQGGSPIKKAVIALVLAGGILLAGVADVRAQTQEPVYGGKTLSQWIEQLMRPDGIQIVPGKRVSYRREAKQALGVIGGPAVPSLLVVLEHENWILRSAAAEALGFIGPAAEDAVPALINLMLDDSSPGLLVKEVALALGKIGPGAVDAVPALVQVLRDKRWEAARGLAGIGPGAVGAVGRLIITLDEKDIDLRREAAVALGSIGPEARRATGALRAAMRASSALARNPTPRQVVNALKEEEFRNAVREALEKIEGV